MKNTYKFWIVFSLIIVFAAGVLGGILLDNSLLDKKPKRSSRKESSVRFPTIEMMAEELSLTQEQQEKIREIFKNNEKRFKTLKHQIDEQFAAMRIQLKQEIMDVLSDEQNTKFQEMIDKYKAERKRQMEDRRRHPDRSKKNKGE